MNADLKEGAIRIPNSSNGYNTFIYAILKTDEPYTYGIDGGRILRLLLRDKDTRDIVASYDCKWNMEPESKEAETAVKILTMKNN